MLSRSVFEHLRGTVAMCLRCGGIFSDHFIIQSLLSLLLNEVWKLVNI